MLEPDNDNEKSRGALVDEGSVARQQRDEQQAQEQQQFLAAYGL